VARSRWSAGELACLAALLIWVAGLCLAPISETDLFFRLKVGQEIWARHGLLRRNLFSFTAPDHPDLDAAWAFELGLAAVHRIAGFGGIVVAKTAVVGGCFAGLFGLCRRDGAPAWLSAILLALAAEVMRERLVERPHIVSFAGEVVVLWGLRGARGPWSRGAWVAFAAAMLAWSNAHAGSFVGTGTLALAALGWSRRDRVVSGRLLAMAGISGAAAFATPLGWDILRYWELHLRIPRIHAVDEFRSATWRSDAAYFAWLGGLAACLGGLAAARLRRRGSTVVDAGAEPGRGGAGTGAELRAGDLLAVTGIAILGALSVRFAADAVLMSAPTLVRACTLVLRDGAPRLLGRGPARRVATAVSIVGLVALAAVPRVAQVRAGHPLVDLGIEESLLPLGALAFVEKHGLRERMYNDFETGSYLVFEGYPRHRVFVDPRLPAYPEAFHALLGRFDLTRAEWDAAMRGLGVQSALLTYAGVNRRVSWWDPDQWALVYRQDDARVFVRRLPGWRALIADLEIPATFSFTLENGTVTLPLEAQPAGSPVPPCEWQRRLGELWFELDADRGGRAEQAYRRALEPPGCLPSRAEEARLAAWLGSLDLMAGRLDAALAHLSRALALSPDDPRTRAARARALAGAGRLHEATAEWTTVARTTRDPGLVSVAAAELRRLSTAGP
jgi:hypothetical protein